jgi:hypothetical protein
MSARLAFAAFEGIFEEDPLLLEVLQRSGGAWQCDMVMNGYTANPSCSSFAMRLIMTLCMVRFRITSCTS